MALESVDLLSLLRRARTSTGTGADEKPSAPTADKPQPEVPAAEEAVPAVAQPLLSEQQVEIAELRAELLGDEVLIQRILGLLYRCKKKNPNSGFLSILDMERILHLGREDAAFVMSYMKTTKVIEMDDKSRMAITVPGIDYLRSVLGFKPQISGPDQATVNNAADVKSPKNTTNVA